MESNLPRNRKGQTEEEFLAAYHPGNYERPSVKMCIRDRLRIAQCGQRLIRFLNIGLNGRVLFYILKCYHTLFLLSLIDVVCKHYNNVMYRKIGIEVKFK